MAGSYPDVPGHRIAYDRDATRVFWIEQAFNAINRELTPAEVARLNDDNVSTTFDTEFGVANYGGLVWIFPRRLDISGMYLGAVAPQLYNDNDGIAIRQYSTDTTNGVDGTWTDFTITVSNYSNSVTARTSINSLSWTDIRAIRIRSATGSFTTGRNIQEFHLYGQPAASEANTNYLAIWHPTLDQRLGPADLDWGDDPEGHTETAQFRVKNLSSTLTASSVGLSCESLSHADFQTAHQFSADDTTYTDTLDIGSLAPGAISAVTYVRKTYSPTQPLGLAWARILTIAGGWS